jgi:ribose 5-phosphate isomerase B
MKISIGADHAGFEMKERVRKYLEARGHAVEDVGTHSTESTDYPIYAFRVAEAVRDGRVERGILLCDSGNGIAIAANKVEKIRATICLNVAMADLARRHNDSNILVLAAAFTAPDTLEPILDAWLTAGFDGGRHARRVGQITEYERTHQNQ